MKTYRKVFVVGTGRCGTTSFYNACKHINNYSCSFEKFTRTPGYVKMIPDDHIVIDNRLSFHLGSINEYFGNRRFYFVWLRRNRKAVAESFAKRFDNSYGIISMHYRSIMQRYKSDPNKLDHKTKLIIANDYIEMVENNIKLFLISAMSNFNEDNLQIIEIENINLEFPLFCKNIKAKVDINLAMREFTKMYNKSK